MSNLSFFKTLEHTGALKLNDDTIEIISFELLQFCGYNIYYDKNDDVYNFVNANDIILEHQIPVFSHKIPFQKSCIEEIKNEFIGSFNYRAKCRYSRQQPRGRIKNFSHPKQLPRTYPRQKITNGGELFLN